MPRKILIVDDDPDVVLFLSTILQDHGFETIEAPDGREGLEKAKSAHPDLILLDLMMPHKSGLSLLKDIQEDSDLKMIPVIMVTGVSGETGINLEAFFKRQNQENPVNPVGYMEKPVDPEKLLRLIEKTLG
jgi:CheY-like chemotaxis protein